MARTKPFDEHLDEYEQWFQDHWHVYQSELAAVKQLIPEKGKGLEIGIGSGIFADPLGIDHGIEPSARMREKAMERGLKVQDGIAEKLPYPDESFDYALMVTTICFVDDAQKSIHEAYRILRKGGIFVIGFVDKSSTLGKIYQEFKERNIFYKDAIFFSTEEIYDLLKKAGFHIEDTCQTVFGKLEEINEKQAFRSGYGEGGFIVIRAIKHS